MNIHSYKMWAFRPQNNYYISVKRTCDPKVWGFITNSSSLYKEKRIGLMLEEIRMSFLPRKIEAA